MNVGTIDQTPTVDTEEVVKAAQDLIGYQVSDDIVDAAAQYTATISSLVTLYQAGKLLSLAPILPLLLSLKGQPYSLHDHYPMEPLFATQMPRSFVFKCGRQVSKSTTLAAQGCIQSAVIPYFSSLYIAPRFEQTRKFSNNYVKPFLTDTPLGNAALAPDGEQSVLQRTFSNGSALHFSYAFLDADRVRGISADQVRYDEVQDLDTEFIPVINETLSASEYNLRQYAGTPKTLDNTLQGLWEDSSQAEWIIPCSSCNHWNIGSLEFDLLGMIQQHGLACAKCGKLINSELGHWEHKYADKRITFAGYHVPQPVMPMHYRPDKQTGRMDKWELVFNAKNSMDKSKFLNEKLGESCDVRVSLLTQTDLQNASVLTHGNTLREALALKKRYLALTMGIDWGGGGAKGISHTTVAILGHRPDGKSDVIFGERLTDAGDHAGEAGMILHYFRAFGCTLIAHDFGGAGAVRETLLLQAGVPMTQIFPAAYVRASAANMVTFKEPSGAATRPFYSVDKARSLVLICQMIKHGFIRFPRFDTWEDLATDFLALVEDKHEVPRGPDAYLITSKANRSDDFAHSVNFAAVSWWYYNKSYPDLASKVGLRLTPEQVAALS